MPMKFLKLSRKLYPAAVVLLVLLALLLTLARIYTPLVVSYRAELENKLSQVLKQPIQIQQVSASFVGFRPILHFSNINLLDQQGKQSLFHVDELVMGINVLKSIVARQPVFSDLVVSGLKLTIKQDENGQFNLVGIAAKQSNKFTTVPATQAVLAWLFSQPNIQFRNVAIAWYRPHDATIEISNLLLALKNSGNVHRLVGEVKLAQPGQTQVKFIIKALGNWQNLEAMAINGYVNADDILLENWFGNFSLPGLQINHGHVGLEGWFSWAHNHFMTWQSKFKMGDVELLHQVSKAHSLINQATGNLNWTRTKHGGSIITGDKLQLTINGNRWPSSRFSLVMPETSQSQAIELRASYLRIQDLKQLLGDSLIIPAQTREWLSALNPKGELTNLVLYLANKQPELTDLDLSLGLAWLDSLKNLDNYYVFAQPKLPLTQPVTPLFVKDVMWAVDTQFKNIAIEPWKNFPGVKNLSGHVRADPTHGEVNINSENLQLTIKKMFRTPLFLNLLMGQAQWQKNENGWKLQADRIYGQNNDLSAYSRLTLLWPSLNESPTINLVAGYNLINGANKSLYLPVGVLHPKVVKWLDNAIVSGRCDTGTLILQGKLADFPFEKANGTFIVDSQLSDITLNYKSGWPQLTKLNAELIFSGRSMTVDVSSGNIFSGTINKVTATIPYLGKEQESILKIAGNVSATLKDGLRFLQESPLKDKFGSRLQKISLDGPMGLQLNLVLSLEDTKTPSKVNGAVFFAKGRLEVPNWALQLKDLQGQLNFTEQGVLAENIKAELFKHPISLDVKTLTQDAKVVGTEVSMAGKVELQDVKNILPAYILSKLTGDVNFKGSIQFHKSDDESYRLQLVSDLQGLGIAFPEPLTKVVAEKLPSDLTIQYHGKDKPFDITFNYGNQVNAILRYNHINNKAEFASGEVHLGSGKAVLPQQPGLVIKGRLQELPWETWRTFLHQKSTTAENSLPIHSIDLQLQHLQLFGQELDAVGLKLIRNENAWSLNLDNKLVIGNILFPDAATGTWQAKLQRLVVKPLATSSNTINPKDLPPLDASINEFIYGDKKLGQIKLQLNPITNGAHINEFRIFAPSYSLFATGEWLKGSRGPRSVFNGSLVSKQLGAFLQSMNLPPSIESEKTHMSFALNWQGSPADFKLENSSGNFAIDLKQGRILDVGQGATVNMALGKLLNVLSLQAWQRRLHLDFSDVTTEGFSFDQIQGNFTLLNGNAYTQKLFLEGSIAAIEIRGRIGLKTHDYNLVLTVTPHVTGSIPIVATIVGGPVAGAIAFAADRLVGGEVQKIAAKTYQVTGSWAKPEVRLI